LTTAYDPTATAARRLDVEIGAQGFGGAKKVKSVLSVIRKIGSATGARIAEPKPQAAIAA
jgi:hypothetical protein